MMVTGRAAALTALGVVPLVLAPSGLTILAWVLLVVVLCTLDGLLAAAPGSLAVSRSVPGAVRLGEPTRCTLTVSAGDRRVRGVVRDAWPPSAGATEDRHRLALPAHETRRFSTTLVPTRRGERIADLVTVRTFGPLGLAGRQQSRELPAKVRVLPEFAARTHLPSRVQRLREIDGRTATNVRGQGTEFDSLREYVPGDDVRSIDWRATARRADVVVRTWRPERDRRVVVVADTGRSSATRVGAGPRLEASIEAALLLGTLAGRAGDRVDFIAYDTHLRSAVTRASGKDVLSPLARATSTIEPALVETDWRAIAAEIRARVSQRSLVVLLTSIDPAVAHSGLLPVVGSLTARHQVVVASVADPPLGRPDDGRPWTSDDVYDAAASARVTLERDGIAELLRLQGAEVVDSDPDALAPTLSDRYLALKAAGRL
ncbi:Uncharacterized conserved protein, DUF58 family, contains vWF domain [Paraoerskovia marina]|uniref:Uncharacterized conserved protein, DUF58 family, contains vWF domain n=1 Tax=Paraoerskovia marina TaxID=545619 RepID=A0A1H1QXW6_9CELL|nr:DUF58 domain-containing protein [Paraoerskovia marina]SDS28192.1 Uncharacterized conserved protein, DUF58 family, contains vWF domain [Paraoerskovia marina]